jgi:RNA polymerase sigma factor (sigma-70 family)
MKKRCIPELERLEARETPDVSVASNGSLAPLFEKLAQVRHGPGLAVKAPPANEQLEQATTGGAAASTAGNELSHLLELDHFDRAEAIRARKAVFADGRELETIWGGSAAAWDEMRLSRALPRADASEPKGFAFLFNYARKAIRNSEARYGVLADHDDLLQQIYVEWRQQVGPGDGTYAGLLDQKSNERRVLRESVRRVIDHQRYEQTKQRRLVELIDQPAPSSPREREWADFQIDCDLGAVALSRRERQLLDLRRQGMTLAEIGTQLGLPKQRVCEIGMGLMGRLQQLYAW